MAMTPFIDPTLLISSVSALLKAIDTWVGYRDSRRAAEAFDREQQAAEKSLQVEMEARAVTILVPMDVLEVMTGRAERCWSRYREVLEGDYLPAEVDEATEAVKACICRELNRIVRLGAPLPPGKLSDWWFTYCAKRAAEGRRII